MLKRISRALRLEPAFYREAADNPQYTTEAVVIAIVAGVIGAGGYYFNNPNGLVAFILQAANNIVIGWLVWALIAYFIGTRNYRGRSTYVEVLRVLGYACAPRVLELLAFIPCAGMGFTFLAWLLSIAAGVYAIRESMEFSMNKASTSAFVGILLYVAVAVYIGSIYSTGGLLFGK